MFAGVDESIIQMATETSPMNQMTDVSGAPLKGTARVTFLPATALTSVGPAAETSSSSVCAPVSVETRKHNVSRKYSSLYSIKNLNEPVSEEHFVKIANADVLQVIIQSLT